jgi:hypothetical protein
MNADLSTVWPLVLSASAAVLTTFGSKALLAIEARLKIQNGSAAADDLDQAMAHGEVLLMDGMKSLAAHNANVTVSAVPLANAVALVQKLAPAAETALGITPQEIESILLARIGVKISAPAAPAEVQASPALVLSASQ